MASRRNAYFIFLFAATMWLPDLCGASGVCVGTVAPSLCADFPPNDPLDCNTALRIAEEHNSLPENIGRDYENSTELPPEQARRFFFAIICDCFSVRCGPVINQIMCRILQGDPFVVGMHEELTSIAVDRSLPLWMRTSAVTLAVGTEEESAEWIIPLLDPRDQIWFDRLTPALDRMENDPVLMRRAMPRLVLAAQYGRDFHVRTSAQLVLLRNQHLIQPELLVPMIVVADRGCGENADPLRKPALESAGVLKNELERILEEMCMWEEKPPKKSFELPERSTEDLFMPAVSSKSAPAGIFLSALAGGSSSISTASCDTALKTDLCALSTTEKQILCEEARELMAAAGGQDEHLTFKRFDDLGMLSTSQAKSLFFGLFCQCLISQCPEITTLVQGHPFVAQMHDDLVALALDRSVDAGLRSAAARLAAGNPDRRIEWAIELLDPRHRIPIDSLRPALERIERNEGIMRNAMPKLVLAAQVGRGLNDRNEAAVILFRNMELLEPDLLVPLLIVASEGCRPTADPVRELALETAGGFAGELERLLDEMCAFEGPPDTVIPTISGNTRECEDGIVLDPVTLQPINDPSKTDPGRDEPDGSTTRQQRWPGRSQ